MVRQSPPSRPDTLERPPLANTEKATKPLLLEAARELDHGRTTVVFPRHLTYAPNLVWSLLTDPKRLALWAPFTADRNLGQVGRATLIMLGGPASPDHEIGCVVFVADGPRLLEYSWANDAVSWTLTAGRSPGSTLLTLRQTLADESFASAVAAGWHLCLDVAATVLDGDPVPPIRGMAAMEYGWGDLNRRYAKKLGVAPSRIG